MLPKHSRLSRESFLLAFKRARRFSGLGFQLLYTPASSLGVSVVVGKKVAALAVKRNLFRRRMYAVMQAFSKKTPLQGHYIVMVGSEIKKHAFPLIKMSLEDVVAKTLSNKTGLR